MAVQYVINNIPGEIDFETGTDGIIRAVKRAKNLLLTRMGEIPYDRKRGFNRSLYDLPLGEFQSRLMEELDRVMLWEPYVEVVSASIIRNDYTQVYFEVVIDVAEEAI